MSETSRNEYAPDFVSAPGETLEEVLEMHGMSQVELAERTGRPKKTINEIMKGKAAITPETALQFELVLGIPAGFWTNREQQYREALARSKEMLALELKAAWLKRIPYRAMVNLGWLPEEPQKAKQLQQVLMFFGVASPERWNQLWEGQHATFRRLPTFESDPGAVAAWLRKGEIEAQKIQSADYNPARFKEALRYVRSLTRGLAPDFAPLVVSECCAAGVRVVFVPELPGTRACGATRWLTSTTALIQLSLRYKTDDQLWFTFFHEAGHILLHGKREYFLEGDDEEQDTKESQADSFALEWLIPQKDYTVFRRLGTRSCGAVRRFAYQLGIAPGIVVGRLQHDGVLAHNQCNDLKKKIGWAVTSE
jgi:HTH-type transcriptional regulator/antitoxin HigA